MGICSSSTVKKVDSESVAKQPSYSLSVPSTLPSHDKPTLKSPIESGTPRAGKSLEIDLLFELKLKAKRENVYTAAVTLDNRTNYKPKNIKKSPEQIKFIGDALDLNFVFASLEKSEKEILTSAMEKVRGSIYTYIYIRT
jgi:hypothetical protein